VPKPPSRPRRRYQRGPHIYPRDGVYYARTDRHPKGVSLKTKDPVEADRRFRALLANPRADVEHASPPELTLVAIAHKYLEEPLGYTRRTHDTKRTRLKAFGEWCKGRGVLLPSEITEDVLSRWLKDRGAKVGRRTVNRDLRDVRVCLRWAADRGYANASNPVLARRGVRESKRTRDRYVPDGAEVATVLAVLDKLHVGAASAVRALYATGLRIEELRRLTPFDVRDNVVHVRPERGSINAAEPGKSYREREIPVAPAVVDVLKRFFDWRSGKGAKGKRVGCSESWLLAKLHAARKTTEVPAFTLHELRAAFATEAFDRGVGLVTIQGWLGHADPATTQGYIRKRRSDRKVVAPVPAGLLGAPAAASEPSASVKVEGEP
jgi:integrase